MSKLNSKNLLLAVAALAAGLSACKKDDCRDTICQPCPSSRVMVTFQDSTGACDSLFNATARIHAFDVSNSTDTLYSYNLNDSCMGALIADPGKIYKISSAYNTITVQIEETEFQEPVEVTECCFCYPLEHAHMLVNGVAKEATFPAGVYDSSPFVIKVN